MHDKYDNIVLLHYTCLSLQRFSLNVRSELSLVFVRRKTKAVQMLADVWKAGQCVPRIS